MTITYDIIIMTFMTFMIYRFTAFSFAGGTAGTVISLPVSSWLCESVGWPSVFYLFGVLGLLWFLVWSALVYDGPEQHPRISQQEKLFLQVGYLDIEISGH